MNVRVEKRPRIHRLSNWLSKQRFWGLSRGSISRQPTRICLSRFTRDHAGAGGTSGSSHTLAEWYDPTNRELGLKRGLLVILCSVGLDHK